MLGISNTNELANSSYWNDKFKNDSRNDIQKKEDNKSKIEENDNIFNLHIKRDSQIKFENYLKSILKNPNIVKGDQNNQDKFYFCENLIQTSNESKKWKYFFLVLSKSFESLKNQNFKLTKDINEMSIQIRNLNISLENKNIKLEILEKENKSLKNNLKTNLIMKKNKELESENKQLNEVKLLNEKAIRILLEQLKVEKQKSKKSRNDNIHKEISEERYMQLSHQHIQTCSNLIEEVICLRSDLEKQNIKSIKNSVNFNSVFSKDNLVSPSKKSVYNYSFNSKLNTPKEGSNFGSPTLKTQIMKNVKQFNPLSRKIFKESKDSDKLLRLNRSTENNSRPKRPYLFSVNHKKQRSVQLL